jgi:hypothetical protein
VISKISVQTGFDFAVVAPPHVHAQGHRSAWKTRDAPNSRFSVQGAWSLVFSHTRHAHRGKQVTHQPCHALHCGDTRFCLDTVHGSWSNVPHIVNFFGWPLFLLAALCKHVSPATILHRLCSCHQQFHLRKQCRQKSDSGFVVTVAESLLRVFVCRDAGHPKNVRTAHFQEKKKEKTIIHTHVLLITYLRTHT